MLKIGLTSGTLQTMPHEDNSPYDISPRARVIDKESISGDANITVTGRTRKQVALKYKYKELSEYETIRPWCFPYVVDRFWVQVTNSIGTLIYDDWAYIIMSDEKISHDGKQYSFSLLIKEL